MNPKKEDYIQSVVRTSIGPGELFTAKMICEMALYRLGLPMDTDIESMPYNERDRFMKERERIRRRLLKMQRWGDVAHIRYDRVDYWCRTS